LGPYLLPTLCSHHASTKALQSFLPIEQEVASAAMTKYTTDRDAEEVQHGTNLGHVRLRHVETNDIILIPTPSNDPKDPLNW